MQATATLATTQINNLTSLTLTVAFENYNLAVNDTFEVSLKDAYQLSKTYFDSSGSKYDFYAPFSPKRTIKIDAEKVATTDGSIVFTLQKGNDFPIYGGQLKFTLPSWVGNDELVFSNGATQTTCDSQDLLRVSQGASQQYFSYIFSTVLTQGNTVTITCTNYKNPTYPKTVTGFQLQIMDNEQISNEIFKYPEFFLDANNLNPQTYKGVIGYDFKLNNINTVPIPIQTLVDLEMQFNLDFPLETGFCYLKVTFPKDFALNENDPSVYATQSNSIFGPVTSDVQSNNSQNSLFVMQVNGNFIQVFTLKKDLSQGNFLVFKGCSQISSSRPLVNFLITNVKTPLAKKTTDAFKFELYRTFDQDKYTFDKQIVAASTPITENKFTPGSLSDGNFKASISYIQTPATHTISFRLKNNFPVKGPVYDSNVLLKMPSIMTMSRENNEPQGKVTDPLVKSLDGFMKVTQKDIIRIQDQSLGCDIRPCYLIRHNNFVEVEGGNLIQFQITGTTNQLSNQTAGNFEVSTQIQDRQTLQFFSIDAAAFPSNFNASIGGISAVSRFPMTSTSYTTWDSNQVIYTIYFQLGNYIPKKGAIKIVLPSDIDFVASPNNSFQSKEFYFSNNTDQVGSFVAIATNFVPAGQYSMTFGGVRNPRSFKPTDPFNMSSYDDNQVKIGRGVLDNIRMNKTGTFSNLQVQQADFTNGVQTDYTVTLSSPIPFQDGDIFYLSFPKQIQIPKEPICIVQNCIQSISCNAEKTRIVAVFQQLNQQCNQSNAILSYTIKNVINAENTIRTDQFQAQWTSNLFQSVGQYSGNLSLTNLNPGKLTRQQIIAEQGSKDFGIQNEYSFRITPTNPIPSLGVIEIIYPDTVILDNDDSTFYANCKAQTTTAYSGDSICQIDRSSRSILIYNIFLELQQSTSLSQFTISFTMTNPNDNFVKSKEGLSPADILKQQFDSSFHINTYTFNPPSTYVQGGYVSSEGKAFVDKIIKENTISELKQKVLFQIDSYLQNDMIAQLKCNAPCYTCLDSDPNYCSSCWGMGALKDYKNYFLQVTPINSTCKAHCDDGYTTNGQKVLKAGDDVKKTYYACTPCDQTCGTCKGQGIVNQTDGTQDYGSKNDTTKCLTCSAEFPFWVEEELKCYVTCGTGYYEKKVGLYPEKSECGRCKGPCSSCQKCDINKQPTCNKDLDEPSAYFCMSCFQNQFVPQDVRDLTSIEEFVQNQASMVLKSVEILKPQQKKAIQTTFNQQIQISMFLDDPILENQGFKSDTGLIKPDQSIIYIDSETTYRDMYLKQFLKYGFPLHSLHQNTCVQQCPPGFTDVSGTCLPCQSPCQTCRGQVKRCERCLSSIPEKYIYGTACYEICPKGTAPNDNTNECIGCEAGCSICMSNDTKICTECDDPLYLFQNKCFGQCPDGFRPSFFGKTCEPETSLPVIYFPFWILALLMLSISIAGKFSSKNVSGQHRIFLSFYCWIGVLDIICLWALLIICIVQGQIWHLIFPAVGLISNYVINYQYKKLMDQLDPQKPGFEDRLTLSEITIINNCDINFDRWATKYLNAAKHIKRIIIFISHKFFQFPFTHFFGYLHCTLRAQEHYNIWEWRDADVKNYQKGILAQKTIKEPNFRFIGKLAPRKFRGFDEIMLMNEKEYEPENDKLLEGGTDEIAQPMMSQFKENFKMIVDKKIEESYSQKRLKSMQKTLSKLEKDDFNPFLYVQHPASYPRKKEQRVSDTRVQELYKWQIKIDIIFIRLPVIIGNIIVIFSSLVNQDVNQHLIEEIESILFSVIIIFAQIYLSKTWEEQKLPQKMKDNKANYLFIQKRSPNEINKAFGKLEDDDNDIMPEWEKYLPFYKFNEIFLDNKLEELLNIFGRRQCKSCIEFPTGWEKEEDPRRTNSWPLSPKAEENYLGRAGEFNLIDFQLQNNVYAETAEPTIMFESVARDFSEFGVQVFQFDILNALQRKGGDLLNPQIEEEKQGFYKKSQKKKRGRKNKYYKQIDQEDDEEANQISDETENDGLDHVKEEDEEDEEEELIRKRKAEEAILVQERKQREEEQRKILEEEKKKKDLEDQQKRKAQEEEQRKRALEEEKRKKQEEEEKKKLREEEQRLLAEEEARKAAETLKMKKEKELREKEQKDYEDRIARELLEAQRKQALEDEALKQQIVRDHSPTKNLDQDFGKVKVQSDALNLYKEQNNKGTIEVPPIVESRRFNECDIIGELDRDEKGNVIPQALAEDKYVDKKGKSTNQRGYLIDQNGNLINNLDGSTMFPLDQLDERGEIPAPFNLEKYNFNPHNVRGDFDFDRNGKAVVITKKLTGATASPGQTEIFIDKRSSKVTTRGYRVDQSGNMIDNYGRKKFDKSHMTSDGDLPKLFNYNGRRYDIHDCIGQLDKDANGEIIPQTDRNGNLVDNLGRRINSKGYLIDEQGNVIDREGRQIFEKKHLQNNEIPKIFPFTKFNLKNILGDFEMDPLGNPMLAKNQKGQLIDSQGRVVNEKGYLIDSQGNVINKNGKKMFGKELLDSEGDIPKVFRTGLLKSDTASSLSRLMSEIEKNQLSDFDQEERRIQEEIENQLRRPKGNSGNTSVDSMMEDTPANYNAENQRFDTNKRGGLPPNIQNDSGSGEEAYGTEEEGMNEGMMGMTGMTNKTGQLVAFELKKKKKKKKKKKPKPVEYEDPSLRDHLMAGAYGGIAKPKIKRQGIKYTTNIDAGLREIITPGSAFRRDPSNRVGLTIHRSQVSDVGSQLGSKTGKHGQLEGTSQLLDPQQREAQLKAQQLEEIRRRKIARAKQLKAEGKIGKISKDVDFEKMFGKDIDEFLEDSEWDIESIDKMSQFSKGSKVSIRSASQTNKLKGLEKVYLQRIEPAGPQKAMRNTGMVGQKVVKKANFRGGDGDSESVNSRNPRVPTNRKKAWDTQSRTSNLSLVRR